MAGRVALPGHSLGLRGASPGSGEGAHLAARHCSSLDRCVQAMQGAQQRVLRDPHRPDGEQRKHTAGQCTHAGREPTGAVCTLHLSVLPSLLFQQPRQPGRPFTQLQPILMFSHMGFPAPHECLAARERRNVSVEPGRKRAPCAWGRGSEMHANYQRKKNCFPALSNSGRAAAALQSPRRTSSQQALVQTHQLLSLTHM